MECKRITYLLTNSRIRYVMPSIHAAIVNNNTEQIISALSRELAILPYLSVVQQPAAARVWKHINLQRKLYFYTDLGAGIQISVMLKAL